VVTREILRISRPDGAWLDLDMSDVTGYSIDVRERPNLRIYLRDREPVDFKVYVAEAFSAGLWESIHRLDGFLPKTARREYIDGTEAPTADASRITSRKLLWYGTATLAFGGAAAAVSVTNLASTAVIEGFMVLSMLLSVVGIALFLCSALAYRRYCMQRRVRLSVEVPGELIAHYEPDYSRVSLKRTLGSLVLVFATAFTIVAFPDWPDFWMGLILGPAFLTVALYLFHLAAIESRTVIVTDQYVGIVRGNRCIHMRHGQYQIIRGSLWLGVYLKVPDHGFILADASGAVGFTNRGNEHGFALNLIAKLTEESIELAGALDAN
jgi:hypothetical protein